VAEPAERFADRSGVAKGGGERCKPGWDIRAMLYLRARVCSRVGAVGAAVTRAGSGVESGCLGGDLGGDLGMDLVVGTLVGTLVGVAVTTLCIDGQMDRERTSHLEEHHQPESQLQDQESNRWCTAADTTFGLVPTAAVALLLR
jgi:hypothetical protein